MTTVAYRDGILAADTRTTTKWMVEDENTQKIWRLSDGSLLGGAGDYGTMLKTVALFQHVIKTQKNRDLPTLTKHADFIFVDTNSDMWWWCSNYWYNMGNKTYLALGTGREFATGAMDAGADAKTAVKIGIKRDKWSGGKVKWLELST